MLMTHLTMESSYKVLSVVFATFKDQHSSVPLHFKQSHVTSVAVSNFSAVQNGVLMRPSHHPQASMPFAQTVLSAWHGEGRIHQRVQHTKGDTAYYRDRLIENPGITVGTHRAADAGLDVSNSGQLRAKLGINQGYIRAKLVLNHCLQSGLNEC